MVRQWVYVKRYIPGQERSFIGYKKEAVTIRQNLKMPHSYSLRIYAPRGCEGIRFGKCQLTLTRIPHQVSHAVTGTYERDLNCQVTI